MDPSAITALNEAAKSLTVVGVLLVAVVAFMTGKLIAPARLEEWKQHATFWREEASKNRDALVAITTDMKELVRAIEPLGPTLKELARDHEETDRCISAITRRLEQWDLELAQQWRADRRDLSRKDQPS